MKGWLLILALSATAIAETPTASTPMADSRALPWQQLDRSQWTLSQAEWKQYESIMSGPRGIWSPNLDPLTALGVSAQSATERRKYAEQLVQMERFRVDGELAFAREYHSAWARLYPNDQLIDPARLASSKPAPPAVVSVPSNQAFLVGDRVAMFYRTDCEPCVLLTQGIVGIIGESPLIGLDLYFVDASADAIQQWAERARLPARLVASKTLTINPDAGLLKRLGGQAPSAYRRRGDEFVPVALQALANPQLYASVRRP